jgi:hypothetical protein
MNVPCLCPPMGDALRHPDGDEITLREKLDFHAAVTVRNSIAVLSSEDGETSVAEVLAVLTENYLLFGIESWTLVDAKGKPVPVSKQSIRELLLSHPDVAMDVGDEADALYAESVMLPLLARAQRSLPPTPTDESTSPTTGSSTTRPKRSKPSSISTIPTAGTVVTSSSLDGDSSSSQSSTSAV